MVNTQAFFENIKANLFNGSLSSLQIDSIEAILNGCDKQDVQDIRQIAYIFATAYWEASNPHHPELRLTPIKEFGGETYLKSKPYYPYFGRGFSQLTWDYNYKREGLRLGLNLLDNPDLILDINYAANSHVYCLKNGSYTGKKLSDYINESGCNFRSARKIVNGTDKADEIKVIAVKFLAALN